MPAKFTFMISWLSYVFVFFPIALWIVAAIYRSFRVDRLIEFTKNIFLAAILTGVVELCLLLAEISSEQTIEILMFHWRIDKVSIVFFTMVSVIGWTVLSFSKNYLWGDKKQQIFTARLIFTIASVLLLMISGDVVLFFAGWVLSGYGLRKLISLYDDRKYAIITGKKKKIMSMLSASLLLVAFLIIVISTGQWDLNNIFLTSSSHAIDQSTLEWAAFFLALAAIVKSAHIPFHGWVLGMMEAPTPVSGILHAGLLNAGPFLIIRFSTLFDQVSLAPDILIIWGGLSAMYGTLVSFYQPAAKTRLSYSSIGHMGFSTMLSGLGLYPAAVLHLIGHSFYKAHTFLSSGSEIDKYRIIQTRHIYFAKLTKWHIISGFATGVVLFLIFSKLFKGTFFPYYPFFVLGFIITIGISAFIVNTSVYSSYFKGLMNMSLFTITVFLSFFLFETGAEYIIPVSIKNFEHDYWLFASTTFIMIMFILLALYAVMLKWRYLPPIPKWDVYVRNGFYLHAWFDQQIIKSSKK